MIRLCAALFLFLFLVSCDESIDDSERRNEDWGWVVGEDGVGRWVETGPNIPYFIGTYTVFYSTGEIYETGFVRNGVHEDTSVIFNKKGEPIHYIIYEEDNERTDYFVSDGPYEEMYQNGTKKITGTVRNHKPDGRWQEFSHTGELRFISDMRDGTGWKKFFHENGERKDSFHFVNGVQNGPVYSWYDDGALEQITNWKNGLQDSVQIFYNPDGSLMQVEMKRNGKLQDTCKKYWPNGNLQAIGYYINDDKHGELRKYHENGNIELVANFSYGVKQGEWYWYDTAGVLYQVDHYTNNELLRSEEK